MSNGLEVSAQGVPLRNAADYQKVLDTRWEVLEIENEINLDLTANISQNGWVGNVVTLATHSLGHPAAFEFFPEDTSTHVLRGFGTRAGFTYTYPPAGFTEDFLLQSDDTGVYLTLPKFSGDAAYSVAVKGLLRIYKNDITTTFKAPVEDVSTIPATNTKIGARIAKIGHRVNDSASVDYKLNTDARMIGVQSRGLQQVGTVEAGKLTINHDAGYRPTYYTAYYDDHATPNVSGGVYPDPFYGKKTLYPMVQFFTFAFADSHTITLRGVQSALAGTFAYLILKDPVDLGL